MARIQRTQLSLLTSTLAVLGEAALYLATDSGTIARSARSRLEERGPDDAAFFANLSSDLQELDSTLRGITHSSPLYDEDTNAAIHDLLLVIQEQYLKDSRPGLQEQDSDGSNSDDGSGLGSPFALLERLIGELNDPVYGPRNVERAIWFCSETKLPKTRSKQRKSLLDKIKKCHRLFKLLNLTNPLDNSSQQDEVSSSIWDTSLFTNAEKLHHTLAEIWECTCFADSLHQDAMFSFHVTPASEHCCSAGLMYFRTDERDALGWKRTRFEYLDQSLPPKSSGLTGKLPRPLQHNQSLPPDFCRALDNACSGDYLRIASGSVNLCRITAAGGSETAFSQNLPLSPCFQLPRNHGVYLLSPKRRMMLALYLAYAFLHLGGGCWWPYTVRSSVRLPDEIDMAAPPSAFFAASLLKVNKERMSSLQFELVEHLNRDMPSLVAFGRLLLELYVGHAVIWERVPAELTSCSEHPFATQMVAAIRACLKPSEPRNTESPCTIREDERLRNAFIKDVVLPIQYILQYGYQVTFKDIFFTPPATRPSTSIMPRRLKTLRPDAVTDDAQGIAEGFCLHDGQDQPQKLDDDSARDADAYMRKLQSCNHLVLSSELCSQDLEETPVQPVRVAILDTGAQISKEQYKHVYQDRLKACRTWLNTALTEGEDLPLGSNDNDGHGTHGTSVLLQATENTDVQIYVAQVFAGRHEKLVCGEDESVATIDRIVNAIRYTVNVWKADVISMSFGFPQRVKAIDSALSDAERKGVLMLAAASNCGGNDQRSWPARDRRVLCVYASTGIGNKYARNPNAMKRMDNFAVLGTSVKALWPNQNEPVRKSGTSTATPICAAIAAMVISALRRSEKRYIAASKRPGQDVDSLQREYREKVELLGRADHMANVLRLMVHDDSTRDGYDYVTPWAIFNKKRSARSIIEGILQVIDV